MDKFADNLRKRAAELDISNAEAARRAGLDERRYGNYITSRTEPDLATLVRIAEALKTTPNALLGVGSQRAPKKGDVLADRIVSAIDALDNKDREVVAVFADALVKLRAS